MRDWSLLIVVSLICLNLPSGSATGDCGEPGSVEEVICHLQNDPLDVCIGFISNPSDLNDVVKALGVGPHAHVASNGKKESGIAVANGGSGMVGGHHSFVLVGVSSDPCTTDAHHVSQIEMYWGEPIHEIVRQVMNEHCPPCP